MELFDITSSIVTFFNYYTTVLPAQGDITLRKGKRVKIESKDLKLSEKSSMHAYGLHSSLHFLPQITAAELIYQDSGSSKP